VLGAALATFAHYFWPGSLVRRGALAEAARLLVQVTSETYRIDGHVGTLDGALARAPEVLIAVGVDVPIYVRYRVIDGVVNEVLAYTDRD